MRITEYQLPSTGDAAITLPPGAQVLGLRADIPTLGPPMVSGSSVVLPTLQHPSSCWLIVAQPDVAYEPPVVRTFRAVWNSSAVGLDPDKLRYIGSCVLLGAPTHIFEVMSTSRAEWERAGQELVQIANKLNPTEPERT